MEVKLVLVYSVSIRGRYADDESTLGSVDTIHAG